MTMKRDRAHQSATLRSRTAASRAKGDSPRGEPDAIPWKKFSGRISYSS